LLPEFGTPCCASERQIQIATLNHPVTVKITELWAVTVKTVKIKQLGFNSKKLAYSTF